MNNCKEVINKLHKVMKETDKENSKIGCIVQDIEKWDILVKDLKSTLESFKKDHSDLEKKLQDIIIFKEDGFEMNPESSISMEKQISSEVIHKMPDKDCASTIEKRQSELGEFAQKKDVNQKKSYFINIETDHSNMEENIPLKTLSPLFSVLVIALDPINRCVLAVCSDGRGRLYNENNPKCYIEDDAEYFRSFVEISSWDLPKGAVDQIGRGFVILTAAQVVFLCPRSLKRVAIKESEKIMQAIEDIKSRAGEFAGRSLLQKPFPGPDRFASYVIYAKGSFILYRPKKNRMPLLTLASSTNVYEFLRKETVTSLFLFDAITLGIWTQGTTGEKESKISLLITSTNEPYEFIPMITTIGKLVLGIPEKFGLLVGISFPENYNDDRDFKLFCEDKKILVNVPKFVNAIENCSIQESFQSACNIDGFEVQTIIEEEQFLIAIGEKIAENELNKHTTTVYAIPTLERWSQHNLVFHKEINEMSQENNCPIILDSKFWKLIFPNNKGEIIWVDISEITT